MKKTIFFAFSLLVLYSCSMKKLNNTENKDSFFRNASLRNVVNKEISIENKQFIAIVFKNNADTNFVCFKAGDGPPVRAIGTEEKISKDFGFKKYKDVILMFWQMDKKSLIDKYLVADSLNYNFSMLDKIKLKVPEYLSKINDDITFSTYYLKNDSLVYLGRRKL